MHEILMKIEQLGHAPVVAGSQRSELFLAGAISGRKGRGFWIPFIKQKLIF
jgi:hypothetical protein